MKAIGFLGAGQMAEALARGFIASKQATPEQMFCVDISAERKDVFKSFGVKSCADSKELVKKAQIIFIAVKPWFCRLVLEEVGPSLTADHVIVSIAAGMPLSALEGAAGADAHLIRVMPNTPCLVGESATAICLGGKATKQDGEVVKSLFDSVGKTFIVEEKLISAVTGINNPAYIFVAIEALSDGGVLAGLPRPLAQDLAAQTVLGAAKMVIEGGGKHPGALKDSVASPAGTTIAGLHALERAGIRGAFMNAVIEATRRSDELAKM